ISAQVAGLKRSIAKMEAALKATQTKQVEAKQIETDIALARETLTDASAGIDKIRGELKSLADKVAKGEVRLDSPEPWPHVTTVQHSHSQVGYDRAERRLQEEQTTLTWFDVELRDLDKVVKTKKQAVVDVDVSIKKLGYSSMRCRHLRRKRLATSQAPSTSRSSTIGPRRKARSQYDFSKIDIRQLKDRARELEQLQRVMKKKVTPNMIDTVEKREVGPKKMLGAVLKDKEKIEQTIEELD
ncbi:hypothetical protein BJV78DRAFT_1155766, partial [Lactifluus subvellereus]